MEGNNGRQTYAGLDRQLWVGQSSVVLPWPFLFSFSSKLFDLFTKDLDEFEELKKSNMAVGIFMAGLVVAFAIIVSNRDEAAVKCLMPGIAFNLSLPFGTFCVFVLGFTVIRAREDYLILVDKKSQRRGVDPKCYLISHSVGQFYLKKVYNAVCGKSGGRKNFEGDLKTPEGKYVVISKIHTGRSSKYGPLFLKLNYPNKYDRRVGRTGSGIGLHGGSRFRRTLGCVRLRNSKIRQLGNYVRAGNTVIIVPETKGFFLPTPRRYRSVKLPLSSSEILAFITMHDVSNDTCIQKLTTGQRRRYRQR